MKEAIIVFIPLLAMGALALCVGLCVKAANDSYNRTRMTRHTAVATALLRQPGFTASHNMFGSQLECSIAIDESRRLVCFVDGRANALRRKVYPAAKLMSVAITEDGTTITTTRTSGSQMFGAMYGEAMYGGEAGKIIGGLSLPQRSVASEVSYEIDLRITVEDLSYPVWTVPVFRGTIYKTEPGYRLLRDQALQWQGLISILIRQADSARNVDAPPPLPGAADDPAPLPPGDSAGFHVCRAGRDIGLIPATRIRALLAAGKLSAQDDMYFDLQLNEWTRLELLPS